MKKSFPWLSSVIVLSITALTVVSLWPMKEPTEKVELEGKQEKPQDQKEATDRESFKLYEAIVRGQREEVTQALGKGAYFMYTVKPVVVPSILPETGVSYNLLLNALLRGDIEAANLILLYNADMSSLADISPLSLGAHTGGAAVALLAKQYQGKADMELFNKLSAVIKWSVEEGSPLLIRNLPQAALLYVLPDISSADFFTSLVAGLYGNVYESTKWENIIGRLALGYQQGLESRIKKLLEWLKKREPSEEELKPSANEPIEIRLIKEKQPRELIKRKRMRHMLIQTLLVVASARDRSDIVKDILGSLGHEIDDSTLRALFKVAAISDNKALLKQIEKKVVRTTKAAQYAWRETVGQALALAAAQNARSAVDLILKHYAAKVRESYFQKALEHALLAGRWEIAYVLFGYLRSERPDLIRSVLRERTLMLAALQGWLDNLQFFNSLLQEVKEQSIAVDVDALRAYIKSLLKNYYRPESHKEVLKKALEMLDKLAKTEKVPIKEEEVTTGPSGSFPGSLPAVAATALAYFIHKGKPNK
jgi:hypothetical protein